MPIADGAPHTNPTVVWALIALIVAYSARWLLTWWRGRSGHGHGVLLNVRVSGVLGEGSSNMGKTIHDPVTVINVKKLKLTASPAPLTDGSMPAVTWKSSAPDQVGIEEIPGEPLSIFATTPGKIGKALISCFADGYDEDVTPVVVAEAAEGKQLNVTPGEPVDD